MIPRKMVPLCLVVVLAILTVITQKANSGLAQVGVTAPDAPVGTSFTYQGMLTDTNGNPISSPTCDFRFRLYDALTLGTQVSSDQEKIAVPLTKGAFTVTLDFGSSAFTGSASWLEVAVKCAGDVDYTTLSPRQPLTAAPYALYAQSVGAHSHWGASWNGRGTGLTLFGGDKGLAGVGDSIGVYGKSDVSTGIGVYGQALITGTVGIANTPYVTSYGVFGKAYSIAGTAGYFTNTSGSGTSRGGECAPSLAVEAQMIYILLQIITTQQVNLLGQTV